MSTYDNEPDKLYVYAVVEMEILCVFSLCSFCGCYCFALFACHQDEFEGNRGKRAWVSHVVSLVECFVRHVLNSLFSFIQFVLFSIHSFFGVDVSPTFSLISISILSTFEQMAKRTSTFLWILFLLQFSFWFFVNKKSSSSLLWSERVLPLGCFYGNGIEEKRADGENKVRRRGTKRQHTPNTMISLVCWYSFFFLFQSFIRS